LLFVFKGVKKILKYFTSQNILQNAKIFSGMILLHKKDKKIACTKLSTHITKEHVWIFSTVIFNFAPTSEVRTAAVLVLLKNV
jgi:hypothetical protein